MDKALGPDDLAVLLWENSCEMVKGNVLEFLGHFHSSESFKQSLNESLFCWF